MFLAANAARMSGSNDIFQKLLTLIILSVVITVVLIVLYISYRLYQMHFRTFMIGHSEPFDEYMKVHMFMLTKYLHFLHRNGGASGFSNELSRLFALDIVPPEDLDIRDMTPENCFALYMSFMFKRALTEGEDFDKMSMFQKMELNLIERLTGLKTVFRYADREEGENWQGRREEDIYNELGTAVKDSEIKYFRKRALAIMDLEKKLGRLECQYKGMGFNDDERTCKGRYQWGKVKDTYPKSKRGDPEGEMARRMLVHLMFHNTRKIELMYDLRKTGGIGNFVIFTIYMSHYNKFIFKEQIPSIWENFGGRVSDWAQIMQSAVRSESVMSFMASLPLKIAGIEGYENSIPHGSNQENSKKNRDQKDEEELQALRNFIHQQREEREVVEPFFDKLGELIKAVFELVFNLIKIVIAVVKMITNPFAIIRFIIGLIIGTLLFVIYMVIVIISPLFYIPAFFHVLTFSIISTVAWIALYLAVVILFVIAWILDFFTNGFILSLFRCENLPNAWYERASYVFSNIYSRALIFCWYPCSRRHAPNGFFCKSLERYQPSFCPQQVIMKSFVQDQLEQARNNSHLLTKPLFFDFKGNYEYFSEDKNKKQQQIEAFLTDQKEFSRSCDQNLREYDFLTIYICNHLDTLLPRSDEMTIELIKKACYKCYCKHYYEQQGSRMVQKPAMLLLKTDRPVQNQFLYLLRKGDISEIERNTRVSLSTRRGEKMYFVNENVDIDELKRELQNNAAYSKFIHVPNKGPSFGFCQKFITTSGSRSISSAYTPSKKKGHILYLMIYALLLLFTISFGFMLLFKSTSK